MTSFIIGAASVIVATVALGLLRILYGPTTADRMMAVQLLGSGTVAVALLLSVALDASILDVGLMLALLAAFTPIGFIRSVSLSEEASEQ